MKPRYYGGLLMGIWRTFESITRPDAMLGPSDLTIVNSCSPNANALLIFWSIRVLGDIPNTARCTQKHTLDILFSLTVLEPCFIPHRTMKPVFYSHSPFWSFSRPFLLFNIFCTQERILSDLSTELFDLKTITIIVAESWHGYKI